MIRLRTLPLLLLALAGLAAQATSVSAGDGGRTLLPNGNGGYITWVPNSDMVAEIVPGTMQLSGPIAAPTWSTSFHFKGIGRNGHVSRSWTSKTSTNTDTSLTYTGERMNVEYLLEAEGLRQNFILT